KLRFGNLRLAAHVVVDALALFEPCLAYAGAPVHMIEESIPAQLAHVPFPRPVPMRLAIATSERRTTEVRLGVVEGCDDRICRHVTLGRRICVCRLCRHVS